MGLDDLLAADSSRLRRSGWRRRRACRPLQFTFDIMFSDAESCERVKRSGVISAELFAKLCAVPVNGMLSVHAFDPALSLKATIARPISSGTAGDSDIFGAQQHAPLPDVEIPLFPAAERSGSPLHPLGPGSRGLRSAGC
jgi:hypothetical protein